MMYVFFVWLVLLTVKGALLWLDASSHIPRQVQRSEPEVEGKSKTYLYFASCFHPLPISAKAEAAAVLPR